MSPIIHYGDDERRAIGLTHHVNREVLWFDGRLTGEVDFDDSTTTNLNVTERINNCIGNHVTKLIVLFRDKG